MCARHTKAWRAAVGLSGVEKVLGTKPSVVNNKMFIDNNFDKISNPSCGTEFRASQVASAKPNMVL
jgi:hypothetical protein